MQTILIQNIWKEALKEEWTKPYMKELASFLDTEATEGKCILPPKKHWFEALNLTALKDVKVVIWGKTHTRPKDMPTDSVSL